MAKPAKAARAQTVNLPGLYKKQERALYPEARFSVIEGSTKSGKTAGCMVWQLGEVLMRRPGTVHWWVAPVYGQAKIAFLRALRDFDGVIESANHSDMTIRMRNGSRWVFKSGENPDGLFGEEVESAVVDEASRMREEAWTAVRSTLSTTRGPARIIGNVKGRGNWFYKLARRAEAGEPGYYYAMLTAQDAVDGGVLDPRELLQAERDLPHDVYRELYFCEPSDNANNPFGTDRVANAFGELRDPGPAVVWGLDIARSVDWTVLVGMDAGGNVVEFHRWQTDWRDMYRRVADSVGKHSPVLADATGLGDPVVSEIQALGVQVTPFVFTATSKQDLMAGLRIALVDDEIRHQERVLHGELDAFEYRTHGTGRVTYSAPDGMHDDAVMALALAWKLGQDLGLVGASRRRDNAGGVYPWASVDRAMRRTATFPGEPVAGLVVGNDRSALVIRAGQAIQHVQTWVGEPGERVMVEAASACDALGVVAIRYDEKELGAGVPTGWPGGARLVGASMWGTAPPDLVLWDDAGARPLRDRFVTLGAACHWEARLRVTADDDSPNAIAIPADPALTGSLSSVKVAKGAGGRVAVTGCSALSDAFALACADDTIPATGGLALWV